MRFAGAKALALAVTDEGWAVAGAGDEVATGPGGEGVGEALARALSGAPVACHDAKSVVRATGPQLRPVHDTMIAAYLLDPRRRGEYDLADVAEREGVRVAGDPAPWVRDAVLVRELAGRQRAALDANGLGPLFDDIELPVTRVLAAMEEAGVRLGAAGGSRRVATARRLRPDPGIWGRVRHRSPKQLGQVFPAVGPHLPGARPVIRSPGTALEDAPIVPDRLPRATARQYPSTLPELVDENDRLHTTFTGRRRTGACPTGQPPNIPIRRDRAQIAAPSPLIPVAAGDCDQPGERILAHCSGGPRSPTPSAGAGRPLGDGRRGLRPDPQAHRATLIAPRR
jgi:DNA polymerase-1